MSSISFMRSGTSHYWGNVKDKVPHGVGTMYTVNDDDMSRQVHYHGSWQHGKRHGVGMLYWLEGNGHVCYVGHWMDGVRHGKGKEFCRLTGVQNAEGAWKNGKRHGCFLVRHGTSTYRETFQDGVSVACVLDETETHTQGTMDTSRETNGNGNDSAGLGCNDKHDVVLSSAHGLSEGFAGTLTRCGHRVEVSICNADGKECAQLDLRALIAESRPVRSPAHTWYKDAIGAATFSGSFPLAHTFTQPLTAFGIDRMTPPFDVSQLSDTVRKLYSDADVTYDSMRRGYMVRGETFVVLVSDKLTASFLQSACDKHGFLTPLHLTNFAMAVCPVTLDSETNIELNMNSHMVRSTKRRCSEFVSVMQNATRLAQETVRLNKVLNAQCSNVSDVSGEQSTL